MQKRLVDALVIEDEPALQEAIVTSLGMEGFQAVGMSSAEAANEWLQHHTPVAIVLDLNLPGIDGLAWLKQFQGLDGTGVIVATAKGDQKTRLACLDAGADAVLTKPFDPDELNLIISNLFKRLKPNMQWLLDDLTWALKAPGSEPVYLTASEMAIISRFADAPGKPVSRENLVTALGADWDTYDPRRLEVMMRRLRVKLEEVLGYPPPIHTVRGVGYAFNASIMRSQPATGSMQDAPKKAG